MQCCIIPLLLKQMTGTFGLKEDQWELLTQMVTVFSSLCRWPLHVFSLEQTFSASIIYPIINDLLLNHLVDSKGDLPAVKRFKHTVAGELKRRCAPSSHYTAKSLPVLCSAVDPQYAHLRFLSEQQREIVREELLGQIESLETEGDKEGTDSTETAGPLSKKSKSSENSARSPNKKSKAWFTI